MIKCKKCGGWRKKYTPCESPCEFGKGWVAPTKAEEEEERKKWWYGICEPMTLAFDG